MLSEEWVPGESSCKAPLWALLPLAECHCLALSVCHLAFMSCDFFLDGVPEILPRESYCHLPLTQSALL